MANINDKLEFEIKSTFDSSGFKQFMNSLKAISGLASSMGNKIGTNLDDKINTAWDKLGESSSEVSDTIKALPQIPPQVAKSFKKLEDTMVGAGIVSKEDFYKPFMQAGKDTYNSLKNDFPLEDVMKVSQAKGFENLFPSTDALSKATPVIKEYYDNIKKMNELKSVARGTDMLGEAINAASGYFQQGELNLEDYFKKYIKNSDKFNAKTAETKSRLNQFFKQYNFGFLSLMFIGQQWSRQLQTIMTKSIGVMTQFSQNNSAASQAVTALSANITLLQFTIGEALGTALLPLLPTLIGIIEKIADWVQQHPELTAGILAVAFAIVSLATVIGTLYALIHGSYSIYKDFATLLGGGAGAGGTSVAGGASAASAGLWGLIGILLIIVAVIFVLYAAWKTNFGGIKDVTNEVFQAIKTLIGTAIGDIIDLVKNLFGFLTALFEMDTQKMGFYFIKFILTLVAGIIKLAIGFGAIIAKLFLGLTDILINLASAIVKVIADILLSIDLFIAKWMKEHIQQPIADGINKIIEAVGGKKIDFNLEANITNKEDAKKRLDDMMDIVGKNRFAESLDLGQMGNFNSWIDKNIAYKDVVWESTTATKSAAAAMTGDGGIVPAVQSATIAMGGPGGMNEQIANITKQLSTSMVPEMQNLSASLSEGAGLTGQIKALNTSMGGEGGLTKTIDTTKLGVTGVNNAMFSESTIIKNSVIPSSNALIIVNNGVATSYDRVASAARRAEAAIKAANAAKSGGSSSSTQEERNRWT